MASPKLIQEIEQSFGFAIDAIKIKERNIILVIPKKSLSSIKLNKLSKMIQEVFDIDSINEIEVAYDTQSNSWIVTVMDVLD